MHGDPALRKQRGPERCTSTRFWLTVEYHVILYSGWPHRGQEDGDLDHATDLSYPAQQGESSTSAAPTTPVELAEDRGMQDEEPQQQGRDSLCIDGSAPVVIDGVGNWLNRVKGVVQDLIVKKLG